MAARSPLAAVVDVQRRLDTGLRRMSHGSLGGRTDSASPRQTVVVAAPPAPGIDQGERHTFHFKGVLAASASDPDPTGRATTGLRVQARTAAPGSGTTDVDIWLGGSVVHSFGIAAPGIYDARVALGSVVNESSDLFPEITAVSLGSSGLVVAVTLFS